MDNKIIDYYNDFVPSQKNSGTNDRIFNMYKRMKKYGLNKHSNVLELGCGIGILTSLLSRTVTKGTIESVDISNKSIEFAKKRINKKNISLTAHDVVDYTPILNNIDIITLFDVIEHIPKERHFELFKNISTYINDDTVLLINIPNPDYIEYDQKYQPEVLQIIDQPIHLDFLLQNINNNGLDIEYFEKHSIWVKNEYIFYVIKKKTNFKEEKLHNSRTFIQKVFVKLFRLKLKLFYSTK